MEALTQALPIIVLATSLIAMLVGLGFVTIALQHRTDKHPPLGSMNPKHWLPIWMMKDWYSPKGFRYHLIGWTLVISGTMVQTIYYLTV